jgi:hypothetical protein
VPDARPTVDDHDLVVLRVPADPRYARVIRIAVSAYAVRLGLVPAAVEDLRLAVDEALILLMGSTAAEADGIAGEASITTSIVLTLDADGDRPPVSVELHLEPGPGPGSDTPVPDASALSRFSEIVPAAVAIEVVDQRQGRVALRYPT